MGTSDNLDKWGNSNRDLSLLVLRLVLGAVLILKGYRFLFHTEDVTNLINTYHPSALAMAFAWIIIFANMAGGLFIIIGVLTRTICLIQIPILVGAMILNVQTHVLNSSEWLLAFVTFFLIVYLYIYGSGKYSLWYSLMKEPKDADKEEGVIHHHHGIRHNY